MSLSVGEAGAYQADATPEGFDGPGLVVLLKFGEVGVAALLPETGGILPEWYATPDPTGESKLSTLAQELSMLLVPETLIADVFEARKVDCLSEALAAAEVAEDATLVPLEIQSGDKTAQLSLIWPLKTPDNLLPAEEEEAETVDETAPASPAAEVTQPPVTDFCQLPGYSQSLLKIEVPVRVVLASRRESIDEVVGLVPGTIVKFDKSCEEMLQLYVGDQLVAEGEAVKVGDKFGFRVGSMVLPDEHFKSVRKKGA